MIKIERREIKACCGKQQIILKLNLSIMKEHTPHFELNNFSLVRSFFDAGIMYLEDAGLVATCPFGSNEIQIKCKNEACKESTNKLEKALLTIGV